MKNDKIKSVKSEKPARYRKIEVRMWGDEKFMRLSSLQPSGQALWLYLLCGKQTGIIPGVFSAGQAALAEQLRWGVKAFQEAFREVYEEGLVKANFDAQFLYLPNAIKHNMPASPNVIRSWQTEWDLLPECDLKIEAYEGLRAHLHSFSECFGKAFDEVIAKPSLKPFGKPFGKAIANQEQEQEQEQEQDKTLMFKCDEPILTQPKRTQKKPKTSCSIFEKFWERYPRKQAKDKAIKAWHKHSCVKHHDAIMQDLVEREEKHTDWHSKNPYVPLPASYLNGKRWEDVHEVFQEKQVKKTYEEEMNERVKEIEKRIEANAELDAEIEKMGKYYK